MRAGSGPPRSAPTPRADADTVFRIASMTKSFTAATVLAAPRRGAAASGRSRRDARPGAAGAASARRGRAGRSRSVASCRCRPASRATIRGAIAAGSRSRRLLRVPGRRTVVRVHARDGVRVLEPRLRDPRPRHHERHRGGVPRRRPLAAAGTAGHDLDRIRGRGVPRRSASRRATSGATTRSSKSRSPDTARSPRWAACSAPCATSRVGSTGSPARTHLEATTRIRCRARLAWRCSRSIA